VNNESSFVFDDYLNREAESALSLDVPFLFVSFPSAKDPKWNTLPGEAWFTRTAKNRSVLMPPA
jgi:hypothetical protein